jgi:xanthine dehydrogenase accessory factor
MDEALQLTKADWPVFGLTDDVRPALRAASDAGLAAVLVTLPAPAMAMLARQVGMETILVRPKGPSAPPPVPDIQYRREAPAAALAAIGTDPWTAVAIAMHQEEDDHAALVAALASSAGYVGLLGSSRRLPRKLARPAEAGISPHQLARLKAPIGLKVGGHSPWEIATGVIAEVIQAANNLPAGQVPVPAVAAA